MVRDQAGWSPFPKEEGASPCSESVKISEVLQNI